MTALCTFDTKVIMKADFADKQKKAAKKKKAKAAKKLKAKVEVGAKGGDVAMGDAVEEAPIAVEEPTTAGDMEGAADDAAQPGARDKHRNAVQLRKNLKVKVQVLKKAR